VLGGIGVCYLVLGFLLQAGRDERLCHGCCRSPAIAVPIASGFQIVTEELTAARRARIAAADAVEKQQLPP
jgi:hypothetical protein